MSKSREQQLFDCLKEFITEMDKGNYPNAYSIDKARSLLSSTGSEPESVDSENPLWEKGYLKGVDYAQSKAKLSSQPSPPSPGKEEQERFDAIDKYFGNKLRTSTKWEMAKAQVELQSHPSPVKEEPTEKDKWSDKFFKVLMKLQEYDIMGGQDESTAEIIQRATRGYNSKPIKP